MATVTLTTDFGDGSAYVAAMKGALLAVDPAARLLDLSHSLPPQDLTAAAYFLADALPWFPPGTIHVVVVDPGVGTARALLCIEWAGQVILVPDNGCWTSVPRPGDAVRVRRLENPQFWRLDISMTFHGRDILAPVAGHLSLGIAPAELGPIVTDWVRIALPQAEIVGGGFRGQVVIVDRFGNLVTNISVPAFPSGASVQIDGRITAKPVKTYGDAEPGTLVALIGCTGRLEIAVVNGSAAAQLGLGLGTTVELRRDQ